MFNHFSFETHGDLEKSPFSETLNILFNHVGMLGNLLKYLNLLGGFNLPLWKMMEFVSWDYDIPNCFWKVIIHVPVTTNQKKIGFPNENDLQVVDFPQLC